MNFEKKLLTMAAFLALLTCSATTTFAETQSAPHPLTADTLTCSLHHPFPCPNTCPDHTLKGASIRLDKSYRTLNAGETDVLTTILNRADAMGAEDKKR